MTPLGKIRPNLVTLLEAAEKKFGQIWREENKQNLEFWRSAIICHCGVGCNFMVRNFF
jgi:hypothetical protein